MKIGLIGPSYVETSLPFDAQRSVNLYPVFDQNGGKEAAALYGAPGLASFATAVGQGVNRGQFPSSNGRGFAVIGATLYEINADGSSVARGALNSSSGIVFMDENPFQLAICDGYYLYVLTYATNAYQQVITPVPFSTVTFIDSFFIATAVGVAGTFYKSSAYDGLTWAALDFATAESSPDPLVCAKNAVGQLWLQGTKTTEIWTNTGASAFPFQKISGAKMSTGILAPATSVELDNSIFWVGQDQYGKAIVYRAKGFSAQRISTSPIEYVLQNAPDPTNLRAFVYQHGGRTFYIITGGGMLTSFAFDISSQFWHERCYLNPQGDYEAHIGSCGMFIFGNQLIGDRRNGNIYILSETEYTDNGEPLCRERTFTHLGDERKQIRYNQLKLGFETGVGTQTGQGIDPQVSLRLSKDGARTWSNWFTKPIGKVGEYLTNVVFRRLGIAQQMTFQIRVTDPVPVRICGAYLQ